MMKDAKALDSCYHHFVDNLTDYIPEGIQLTSLEMLYRFGALYFANLPTEEFFARYFEVLESHDKVTLVNERFAIWIVPDVMDDRPITYVLIALNGGEKPTLETGFAAVGIYNTSKLVLRLLEKMLMDIEETEDLLYKMTL